MVGMQWGCGGDSGNGEDGGDAVGMVRTVVIW